MACRAIMASTELTPVVAMYHIVQVGMNPELLERLDALRPFYPDAAYRKDIINLLIAEAYDRLVAQAGHGGIGHNSTAGALRSNT